MIVESMKSPKGNTVANQFIINDDGYKYFQSYRSMIACIHPLNAINPLNNYHQPIKLDERYWNYSRTTSKYLSIFLNESIKDIKRKVKEGIYLLVNLN